MIVRELLTRLGWSVDTAGAQKYDNALNKVNRQAMAVTTTLQGMMAAAAAAFSVSAIGKTLDAASSLEAQIAQLPQTIKSSGDAFNDVVNAAINTRSAFEPYADFFVKASHATKDFFTEQKQVLDMTNALGMAMVATGTKAQQQSEMLFQLGQAIGSPTVQMEEMNTVIDGSSQIFYALGNALGFASGEFKKAISEGKVTGQDLAKAIVKIGPEFEERFKRMPMTIGQATVIASNKWARFLAKMNRESGAVTWILGKFNALVDGLEKFGDASVKFFGSSTNAVKALGLAITAVLLPSIVKLSASMLAFLASPTGLLLAGLVGIALVAEDIYQWIQGNDSLIGKVAPKFKDWSESVKRDWQATKKVFTDLFSYIEGRIDYVVNAMKNMIPDWLKDAVSGGAKWVSETATAINQAGAKDPNLVYGASSTWRAGAAAGTAADTLYGGARGGDVKIENLNVDVSNSNASAKDIATETSKAISSRQRVSSMSAMGAKS